MSELASETVTDSDVPSPLWIVTVSFETVIASVARSACDDVLATFAAMLVAVVDAKFASSPRAAASSLSVFNVLGAESDRFAIAVSTYERVAVYDSLILIVLPESENVRPVEAIPPARSRNTSCAVEPSVKPFLISK